MNQPDPTELDPTRFVLAAANSEAAVRKVAEILEDDPEITGEEILERLRREAELHRRVADELRDA